MKIVDVIGNSIKSGRLLFWKPQELYVKVTEAVEATPFTPGYLTVEIKFAIQKIPKGNDAENGVSQFKDFIAVFDPEDELKTNAMLHKVAGG